MSEGLEGVVAARTVLSDVDGAAGRLIIRGWRVEDLAGQMRFEDAARMLFEGFFDDLPGQAEFDRRLGEARAQVFAEARIREALARLEPIEAVRALIAAMPDGDDLDTALRLLAGVATFSAAVVRLQAGQAPVAPDPDAGHAHDFLRMLCGSAPSAAQAQALDAYLVTVCDHGLNASTFAARVVASTRAGLTSSVLAGISALKGPLHGGAPGPIIAMLDEIGEPARARAWIEDAVDRGERLMGFGHRVYKVRDPRADALKAAIGRLAAQSPALPGRLAFAEAVEQAVLSVLRERKPKRPLDTNVEFYTALLLEALGFPAAAFTCTFAAARTAGWIAHAREQQATGRLIRPESLYIGPQPEPVAA
jgi:citrate synthase